MKKYIYALFAALLLMTSCSTTKKVPRGLTGPNPEQARFETLIANHYKYEALQSKVKLSMGKSSLNGRLCLESGKRLCLLVNAPLLGFEVARIEATRDEVLVVDKMDKVYAVVTLGELTGMDALAGHEVEALECLMLGRIFIPGKGQATNKDYSLLSWQTPQTIDDKPANSIGTYKGKDYELNYTIDAQGQLVSTTLSVKDGKTATWNYGDYQDVDKKLVATNEEITAVNSDKKTIKAGLSMSNPSLGESTWRDFEANSSYRRVTLSELSEIIKNLIK